jgi:cytochrome b561
MTPPDRYNATYIWLHWLLALGIAYAFGLGWVMTGMEGITPAKLRYFSWHKWLGVTLFVLSVARIAWRCLSPPPELPATVSPLQRRAAAWMHYALYFATLAVPISGYLYSLAAGFPVVYFGRYELPVLFGKTPALIEPLRLTHAWLSYAMAAGVSLHAAAALLHHFHYRDAVLTNMLPAWKRRS